MLEARNRQRIMDDITLGLDTRYAACPEYIDAYDWAMELEIVGSLFGGYAWRYELDDVKVLETELQFEVPLINPETGAASRTFHLAGKLDAIAQLADGREDIGPESDYWLRLRVDPQISQYVVAARAIGHNIETVLYDVTRKPTIRPRQIPEVDGDGLKIVTDDATGERVLNKNGSPRQTGGEGMTVKSRPETPEEFGKRLLDDIGERPDYYYQRREIPRLEDDLLEFNLEVWQQAKHLMDCRSNHRWFRNAGRWTCPFCEFADLCLQSIHVDPGLPPAGYEILSRVHPELLLVGDV
jgi:hypothetical protein